MPRQISGALMAHLQGDTLCLCTLVKVARPDGVQLGFTSHSADLTMNGLVYKANSAMALTAIQQSVGTGVDNAEAEGGLSDDRITEADLLAGRYDDADVIVMLANWSDLSMGTLTLGRYRLGEVSLRNGTYRAELRGLTELLKQQTGNTTSPLCRCNALGDLQCKVGLSAWTYTGTVANVVDDRTFLVSGVGSATGMFSYGWAEFSGALAGLKAEIKSSTLVAGAQKIEFRDSLFAQPAIGDAIKLVAGCDRTFATCSSKFLNGPNFHGEPLLPGNDQVMQIGRIPS